ncbi:MAG: hypothetical protein E2O39_10295 [Planctomycetota bacterium]|nr:MAG: hypothetical protein E2O39_10295 [Planctomycetota bacterium]
MILFTRDRSSRAEPERYRWTPTDDTLYLAPGPVELRALAGVFFTASSRGQESDMQSAPVSVELVPGAPVSLVVLQLEGRTGIRGFVDRAKDRVLVRGGTLHLLPLVDDQPVDLEVLAGAKPSVSVSGGGEYSFLDLAPGRYALGFRRQGGFRDPVVAHWIVEVGSGIVRNDIEIPPLDPKGYVVARVLGPEGELLNGVRFKLGGSSGQQMRDVDGNYCIPIPVGGDDPLRLEAEHKRYGNKSVELSRGQAVVEIRFTQPAQLEIRVTGYLGSGSIDRVGVSVHRPGVAKPLNPGRAGWTRSGEPVDHDGVLKFGALEPGRYEVTLHVGGRTDRSSDVVATRSVALSAGENAVSIALPALYDLDVVVPGAEEGSKVRLDQKIAGEERGHTWSASCDEAGGVRFEHLLGGEYLVRARGAKMRIQVPCGTVMFEPDDG